MKDFGRFISQKIRDAFIDDLERDGTVMKLAIMKSMAL